MYTSFYLLQGLTLGLSAALTPGPLQAYLLSQTMKQGWRRTLPATFAPLLSDGPIVVVVLIALANFPSWFLNGIRIVGGVFLLFLAWGAFQAFKQAESLFSEQMVSTEKSFAKAILVNFLSPGPYIFWTTITGPLLLAGWRQAPVYGLSLLFGFYGAFIGCTMLLVLLVALARQAGPLVVKVLLGFSVVALLLFGLFQIASGVGVWG